MRILGSGSINPDEVVAILTEAEVQILEEASQVPVPFYVGKLTQALVDRMFVGQVAIETCGGDDKESYYYVSRIFLPSDAGLRITLKGKKAKAFEIARRGKEGSDGPWFGRHFYSWSKDAERNYKLCCHCLDNHHKNPDPKRLSDSKSGRACLEQEKKTFKVLDKIFRGLGL